ncbi:MAG TPA: 3-deoxy-7-phosphoheptulonate synthase [Candidatus Limnocylindria bacterium]|jgi:3-deoxy-7-phosphoheptulonate synthase|nr:3-deoxy-7-phosphoheptulonate synthase [Candidatus Limnocylindria bacterium]
MQSTNDLRVVSNRRLMAPNELKAEIPMSETASALVVQSRQTVQRILRKEDSRMLVVVGPCSIHETQAALEYARRLKALSDLVADQIFVVMRVYFEKPRTTIGWKGLINDPHLDGTYDVETGLRRGRKLLLDVTELGLPSATEFLDPVVPQYIADLVSWAAIGARTTESQTHREMASGLSMPVGFKNGTDGSLQIALDAMTSARHSHHFLGIDQDGFTSVVRTTGNQDAHIVLRGGHKAPNFDAESIASAAAQLTAAKLPPVLMVDCSHANSRKVHANQADVWQNLVAQRAEGSEALIGAMIESHLFEGNQPLKDPHSLRYGVSITDACLGWEVTEKLLLHGAEVLRKHGQPSTRQHA